MFDGLISNLKINLIAALTERRLAIIFLHLKRRNHEALACHGKKTLLIDKCELLTRNKMRGD